MSGPREPERLQGEVQLQGDQKMSAFVYLYRGGEPGKTPEAMQQTMQKWMNWMKELGDKGHIKDPGHPLDRTGKIVKGNSKSSITDAPLAETKDVIGGYTLIEAKDLAQASELSLGCPIFATGGVVEVRPVVNMTM
jgi:hypothetical protein